MRRRRTRSSPSRPTTSARDQVGLAEEVGHERGRRRARRARPARPSARSRPAFITAMVSAIVMASSWSWVTCTKVMPTSVWIRLSSICICRRSLRSSAPSGSSSSSTCGPVDQRPGQRDPLLLAAGELGRLAPGQCAELDQLEHLVDLRLDVLDAAPAQPEGDVLEDVQVREQRVALEDRVDRPLVGLGAGDVLAADADRARRSAPPARRPSAAWWSCRSRTGRAGRRTSPAGPSGRGRRRR